MRGKARLWKFWVWELALAGILVALGTVGLLYLPETASVVQAQQVEIQLGGVVLAIIFVTVVAYRLATGTLVGVVKWFARLLGSGLVVLFLILLPLILSQYVLKPRHFSATSPFVALFVLWCFYGVIFLTRWQTRLFYRLMDQIRLRETDSSERAHT